MLTVLPRLQACNLKFIVPGAFNYMLRRREFRLAPVSNVNFFSKPDNLSKIEIYKLYLEVEVLGLDISKFDYQRG